MKPSYAHDPQNSHTGNDSTLGKKNKFPTLTPKIRAARTIAYEFDQTHVIILMADKNGSLSYASYGRTKSQCTEAKELADLAFNAIVAKSCITSG